MKRRMFLVAIAAALFGSRGRLVAGKTQQPASERGISRVRVKAVSAKTRQPLKGARVFVLAADGTQLAEAHTDGDGIATMPQLVLGSKPIYVLVDCDWYFVTGRRWVPELLEYQMEMLGLTPPGFMG
jgi:hypothetical protein